MSRDAKLYVITGSHSCKTGMLMLEHKGIPYKKVELPTGMHPLGVRLLGFPSAAPDRDLGEEPRTGMLRATDRLGTVPALKIRGERIQSNNAIARHLEGIQPDPPLFPADPDERRAVEEAEAWGNDIFQMVARRLALAAVEDGPDSLSERGASGRLGPLLYRNDTMRFRGSALMARFGFAATGEAVERLKAELPGQLDRIDAWISAGVLNGEVLNAADLMIAPSLALIAYRNDLRPQIESRPAQALVDRVLPQP